MGVRISLVLLLALGAMAALSCSSPSVTAPIRPLELQSSARIDLWANPTAGTYTAKSPRTYANVRLTASLQRSGASGLSVDATLTNLGPGPVSISDYPLDLGLYSPQGVGGSARFNFDGVKKFSIPAPTGMHPLVKGASATKHFDVDVSKLAALSSVATVTVATESGLRVSTAWSAVPRTR